MTWKEEFVSTIKKHGECYVNYLMGATLHYVLYPNDYVVELGWRNEIGATCSLHAENFNEWIDLTMVASITPTNIIRKTI